MSKSIWVIRILFLTLCTLGGYAISQVDPELIDSKLQGIGIGFGMGGLLIAIDEMLKGFSLRAFSAATFGLLLGTVVAWMIDTSQLFNYTAEDTRWIIRLALFLAFGYIGMILALRSNKEDFSLIIPFVRFSPKNHPDRFLILDTSAIIDGRIVDLIEANFIEGLLVIPRFVLRELHAIADSSDITRQSRGRHGLERLAQLQQNLKTEVKIHEGDIPSETKTDAKLLQLAKMLDAKLFTTDYNLGKLAELQSIPAVNVNELSKALRPVILPGDTLSVRLVREGKDRGQGVGYLNDGTMIVVNLAEHLIGRQVTAQVTNLVQTGAGIIVFCDLK
ncbi:MAG: twitching motility protein PilT [Verrucomicrobia bacterium]|nr:twitching motility protein PilT [Verrucomicrobiota bacterium]MCF7709135.1 twitching motility protein PilT [Verrucomicrobiota bacterium]